MKILQFIGTRPELIKLAPLSWAARDRPGFALRSIFTGQHVDLVRDLAATLEIDFRLMADAPVAEGTVPEKIADITAKAARLIAAEAPDLVVVQGDTVSAFGCAVAASYGRIPVAHVEAGLRSFDRAAPWPEENLRRQITQIADMHFAPTAVSRANLLAEGVAEAAIHVVGNTVVDAVRAILARSGTEAAPRPAAAPRFGILTMHRREMLLENGAANILERVAEVAEALNIAFVFPVHPSPLLRGQIERAAAGPRIRRVDPVDYPAFIRMLRDADIVITDSGGIQEEATFLRVPTICLRSVTERPEAVAAGAVRLVGPHPGSLVQVCAEALAADRSAIAHTAFGSGTAGPEILRHILRDRGPA